MQWLIPMAMGIWAVWTWTHDQELRRSKERERVIALYVNPFLSACEDLQSRIYNILELRGLQALQKHYPDGAYAEETLYLIARYFGWMATMHRYGPYVKDARVIQLAEAVRTAFATADAEHPAGPFNFFHTEQKALGKLVMHRMTGQYGVELDTISYYEFKRCLSAPPLSESESVRHSLEALRNTGDAHSLPGHERLREAQHHLVDLLAYIETKEGYSFFLGERKKCLSATKASRPNELPSVSTLSPA